LSLPQASSPAHSRLKGIIAALAGDDNPIEIEEFHFEQEDILKQEEED